MKSDKWEGMSGMGVLEEDFFGMGRFGEGGGRDLRIEVGGDRGWEGGQPSLGGEAGSASGGRKAGLRHWTEKESVLEPC